MYLRYVYTYLFVRLYLYILREHGGVKQNRWQNDRDFIELWITDRNFYSFWYDTHL